MVLSPLEVVIGAKTPSWCELGAESFRVSLFIWMLRNTQIKDSDTVRYPLFHHPSTRTPFRHTSSADTRLQVKAAPLMRSDMMGPSRGILLLADVVCPVLPQRRRPVISRACGAAIWSSQRGHLEPGGRMSP